MHYGIASPLANNLLTALAPYCDIINIAGSIRRLKTEVKDIEIVALPTMVEVPGNLFEKEEIRTPLFASALHAVMVAYHGRVLKGKVDGRYMQLELSAIQPPGFTHPPVNLDLFLPEAADYYRQYAIRTGSAEYAQHVIAAGWRKIGWCGSDKGLRRMADCTEKKDKEGKHTGWICNNPQADKPPHWQSEREFFDWIKVDWVEPRHR